MTEQLGIDRNGQPVLKGANLQIIEDTHPGRGEVCVVIYASKYGTSQRNTLYELRALNGTTYHAFQDHVQALTPAAPAAKVEAAPVAAKAKTVKLSKRQREFLQSLQTSKSVYVGPKSYDWISTVKSLEKRGLIQGSGSSHGSSYTLTAAGRDALNS